VMEQISAVTRSKEWPTRFEYSPERHGAAKAELSPRREQGSHCLPRCHREEPAWALHRRMAHRNWDLARPTLDQANDPIAESCTRFPSWAAFLGKMWSSRKLRLRRLSPRFRKVLAREHGARRIAPPTSWRLCCTERRDRKAVSSRGGPAAPITAASTAGCHAPQQTLLEHELGVEGLALFVSGRTVAFCPCSLATSSLRHFQDTGFRLTLAGRRGVRRSS